MTGLTGKAPANTSTAEPLQELCIATWETRRLKTEDL